MSVSVRISNITSSQRKRQRNPSAFGTDAEGNPYATGIRKRVSLMISNTLGTIINER